MAKIRAIMDVIEEIMIKENMIKENITSSEAVLEKVYATGYRGSTTNIMIAYCLIKKKQANDNPIVTPIVTPLTSTVSISSKFQEKFAQNSVDSSDEIVS